MSQPSPPSPPPPSLPEETTPPSPKTAPFLETLGVEYPPDHPIARRASALQAQKERNQQAAAAAAASSSSSGSSNITPVPSPSKGSNGESFQAHLLEQFSTPLSLPSSPAEQARRMSITPASRRNSILAIPPIQEDIPAPTDHLPEPGTDAAVDLAEIEKEIEVRGERRRLEIQSCYGRVDAHPIVRMLYSSFRRSILVR